MPRGVYVLGVAASNHDRAAALLRDGELVCAISEERLDRRKHSPGYLPGQRDQNTLPPMRAITAVLREGGVGYADVTLVVCGRSLYPYREALLQYFAIPEDRIVEPAIPAHHLAHAYSAFATSPFPTSAVLVLDEQGHRMGEEYERASWFAGRQSGRVELVRMFLGDARTLSLGMFYSSVAAIVGLTEAGFPAAGKLMGLAGTDADVGGNWPPLVRIDPHGGPYVDLAEFDALLAEVGVPRAEDAAELTSLDSLLWRYRPFHWSDPLARRLACFAQSELQRGILATAAALRQVSDQDTLCLAGGVALNGPAVTRLASAGWRDVFVHPAATDDGIAVGLAYYGWHEQLGRPRAGHGRAFNPFLGPRYSGSATERALEQYGLRGAALPATVADIASDIADGQAVCWFSGRSEWGPRALGGRSILLRISDTATARINLAIKHREPFRPVGISLTHQALVTLGLDETVPPSLAPYMIATTVVDHPSVSAVRHADGTLRIQVVPDDYDDPFYELLLRLGELTGIEAVINTSFNGLGEPLVETPEDAVRQFLLLAVDSLYLHESHYIKKLGIPDGSLASARAQAATASSLTVARYTNGLVQKGLFVQARDLLATWPEREPTRSNPQLSLLRARIALALGDKDEARRECCHYLATHQDRELLAVADVLLNCGDADDAARLAVLAEPGRLLNVSGMAGDG